MAMGSAGTAIAILKLQKQQAQMVSAWVDHLVISYVFDDVDGLPTEYMAYGVMFSVTNHNTNAPGTENIISSRGSPGTGGTVRIPVKRRIVDDDFDADSGDHALALWAEIPDITATANIQLRVCVEAFGRWHKLEAL